MKQKINENFNMFEKNEEYGVVYGFNYEEAVIWYNIAAENLITSEILLENGRFAHAAFFMQQSIECFIKGILIHSEVTSSSNAKYISHNLQSTICEFYQKVGDERDLKIIENIQNKLLDCKTFSEKITQVIRPSANNLFEQFQKAITDHIFSIFTIQTYINNMLILLSLLFDHGTQQDTRYYSNKSYPFEKYTADSHLDEVLVYLNNINDWIKELIKQMP